MTIKSEISFAKYESVKWRAVIQFISSRIPGDVVMRHLTIANSFCPKILGRQFSMKTDFIHIAGDFYADGAICWLLIDLNSTEEPGLDVNDIPLSYFKTRYPRSDTLYVTLQLNMISH